MNDELNDVNAKLTEVSKRIFGDDMELLVVDPSTLVPTRKNARYMAKEVFDQLTSNVKGDGALQSMPLCHRIADGRIEILSGNHRVKAAVTAGLKEIIILCFKTERPQAKKRAIQLSHNAIVGQDDMQLLVELWREIDDINLRMYSGLDSKVVGELAKVNFQGFGAEQVKTESITLWFVPDEVANFDALIAKMADLAGASQVYLAPLDRYEKLFRLIVEKKRKDNIKNTAVAMMALIDELAEMVDAREAKEPVAAPQ